MWPIRQYGTLGMSASEARPLERHLEGLAYRDPLTPFQLRPDTVSQHTHLKPHILSHNLFFFSFGAGTA